MDFSLPDDVAELRRVLRAYLDRHATVESVAEADRTKQFPMQLWNGMAELGLLGIGVPEEYGGSPADSLTTCVVIEELARASAALTYAFCPTVTFCAPGIAKYGTDEQKKELLPRVVDGTLRFAMGLTEPDSGSDLGSLSTKARKSDDGGWVVNGQKIFTTGADSADYIFTFVRTDPQSHGTRGLSILLIPADAPGVTIRPLEKLSGQATHTCEVFFSDVAVPSSALVGTEGEGTSVIFELLDAERVYGGAQGCGVAQGALEIATQYARERTQFGVPIIQHQAVGHMLADMTLAVESARLMTWRAAVKVDAGEAASIDASLAKIAGSEAGTRCAELGMQVLGGYSYMVEYGMERYWRECKLYEIAGGTNQIQRNIIAKTLAN